MTGLACRLRAEETRLQLKRRVLRSEFAAFLETVPRRAKTQIGLAQNTFCQQRTAGVRWDDVTQVIGLWDVVLRDLYGWQVSDSYGDAFSIQNRHRSPADQDRGEGIKQR